MVPDEEVDDYIEAFEVHFLLVSHMFSTAGTPAHELTRRSDLTKLVKELEEVTPLVDRSTERLALSKRTPKRHIFSHHLIPMIMQHGGIAEYHEDWLEQVHQLEKSLDARAKRRDLTNPWFVHFPHRCCYFHLNSCFPLQASCMVAQHLAFSKGDLAKTKGAVFGKKPW